MWIYWLLAGWVVPIFNFFCILVYIFFSLFQTHTHTRRFSSSFFFDSQELARVFFSYEQKLHTWIQQQHIFCVERKREKGSVGGRERRRINQTDLCCCSTSFITINQSNQSINQKTSIINPKKRNTSYINNS